MLSLLIVNAPCLLFADEFFKGKCSDYNICFFAIFLFWGHVQLLIEQPLLFRQ